MKIYIICHGETEWNKIGLIQGHKDSPLTSRGERDARKKAEMLLGKNIEVIYTSDLGRCVHTANIINNHLQVNLIKTEYLREQNFGDLNGQPSSSVKDLNYSQKPPNGESLEEVKRRVLIFLQTLKKENYKTVLFVTHSGTARTLLSIHYNCDLDDKRCMVSQEKIYQIAI